MGVDERSRKADEAMTVEEERSDAGDQDKHRWCSKAGPLEDQNLPERAAQKNAEIIRK